MTRDGEELSLQEAATALGVHYMTAYKYVRQGDLAAEQVGRRWVVEQRALDAFTQRRTPSLPGVDPTTEGMRLLLESGDEAGAWEMLIASGAKHTPIRSQQDLIAPAMRETGRRWAAGLTTVAQEHIATAVAQRLIARLGTPNRRGRRKGRVLVGCPPGDLHTLATAIFANLVRREGVDVVDLGQLSGVEDIRRALARSDSGAVVSLAVSCPGLVGETTTLVREVRSLQGVKGVLVGGIAVADAETAEALGSDGYFRSAEAAAEAAAQLARKDDVAPVTLH